jgi:hypothetical protein
VLVAAIRAPDHPSKGVADRHKGELDERQRGPPPTKSPRDDLTSIVIEALQEQFVQYRIIPVNHHAIVAR